MVPYAASCVQTHRGMALTPLVQVSQWRQGVRLGSVQAAQCSRVAQAAQDGQQIIAVQPC